MNFVNYNYQVIVNFVLTMKEIDHLLFLCSKHYDFKCQSAGLQGGFIYGWKNRCWNQSETEIDATIKEINLVTKILETETTFAKPLPISLSKQFNEMIQKAILVSNSINESELAKRGFQKEGFNENKIF